MFLYELCEIFKNIFFTEHLWATASKYEEIFYAFDLKRERSLLESKIRKVLGFFYKLNRKLL